MAAKKNPYQTTHARIPVALKLAVSDLVDDWVSCCREGKLDYEDDEISLDEVVRVYAETFAEADRLAAELREP